MTVQDFTENCIRLKPDIVVQKFLIENESYFFSKIKVGEEFDFKKDLASTLDIHIRDIVIVGSGKLGFSLKPDSSESGLYLFKSFDSNPHKKSDLDIGIISQSLFDKEMRNLYDYTNYYRNIWDDRNSFAKYMLKGKLAIRFLPIGFKLSDQVKNVVEKYQMEYGREINLEIYKSWYYFETYHQENIKTIQVNLIK